MRTFWVIALVFSLGLNAWGWVRRERLKPAVGENTKETPNSTDPARMDWLPTTLAAAAPAELRDRLRAAGVDDTAARLALEGVLRRRYREALARQRVERDRNWWKVGRSRSADEATAFRENVSDPLEQLMGRDSLEVLAAESRYAFLPPDKRRRLAEMDLDYRELQRGLPAQISNLATASEAREARLLDEERRKDLTALLTPEELAEYDLRFPRLPFIGRRLEAMEVTEAEARLILPIIAALDGRYGGGPNAPVDPAASDQWQSETVEKLIGGLGYERTQDFLWGSYNHVEALRHIVQRDRLPAMTPKRVMELAQETGLRAAQVHGDAALDVTQKREALVKLQASTQARLDALLPRTAQNALADDGLQWLSGLGRGEYHLVLPSLLGSGGYAVHRVEAPPANRRPSPLYLPPR